MAEIIFSKVPYFKHILLNYFRRICLMYENYPLRDILFLPFLTFNNIQVAAWNYKSLIAKTVENKKGKSYLGYKEQKKIFPVIYQSKAHFGFASPLFCAWSSVQVKLPTWILGWDELNLSRPVSTCKTIKAVVEPCCTWTASLQLFPVVWISSCPWMFLLTREFSVTVNQIICVSLNHNQLQLLFSIIFYFPLWILSTHIF